MNDTMVNCEWCNDPTGYLPVKWTPEGDEYAVPHVFCSYRCNMNWWHSKEQSR